MDWKGEGALATQTERVEFCFVLVWITVRSGVI